MTAVPTGFGARAMAMPEKISPRVKFERMKVIVALMS
jgi:hypothetical protein